MHGHTHAHTHPVTWWGPVEGVIVAIRRFWSLESTGEGTPPRRSCFSVSLASADAATAGARSSLVGWEPVLGQLAGPTACQGLALGRSHRKCRAPAAVPASRPLSAPRRLWVPLTKSRRLSGSSSSPPALSQPQPSPAQ